MYTDPALLSSQSSSSEEDSSDEDSVRISIYLGFITPFFHLSVIADSLLSHQSSNEDEAEEEEAKEEAAPQVSRQGKGKGKVSPNYQ